jgi:T5SS/PEP-CTERM-associated repeat protein
MKTHFANPSLRFATALSLLLFAAAQPASGAVTFSGDTSDDGTTVIVGNTGQGSLTIDGGSSLSNTYGTVGLSSGSNGTVTVSGGNWNSSSLAVGRNGNGSLNLSGTGNITSNDGAWLGGLYDADSNAASGTANVSGGSWTVGGLGLTVGMTGTGILNLSGGNVTHTGASGAGNYVGWYAGALGTANVSGGTWSTNEELSLGGDGGTGILNLSGTGLVTNTEGYMGGSAYPPVSGVLGVGIANISGGTWTNTGNLTVGLVGNGTLNLTENGTVSVGGILKLANNAGSTGTLNLGNGTTVGTLSAATITGGNGTAVVNINQSGSYTLGSNMTGRLSLNHIGTGTLTLNGSNTYTGATTVNSGTLQVATGGSLAGGKLYIGESTGDNGTLNITGGSINHSGSFDYIGSASSGATSVGTANVSAGTWTNSALEIGTGGAGTLNLSGTGNISSGYGWLGYLGTGTGTANVSGGSWTIGGVEIGSYGTGTLNLSGGNVTVTGAEGWGSYLGFSAGALGTANVSGGTWSTNQELSIGGDGGTGLLNLSGSGLVTNTEGYMGGYPGSSGAGVGIANISGGTWTNTGNLTVGLVGNGTINLTENGTVSVGGILKLANNAGSTGTLNLGNGTTAGTLSAATITGGNGTAVVNINQSGSYSLGSNMTGSLALNHIGTGNTTLTGANTYTGNTTISAGALNVNGSLASTATVQTGAKLTGSGSVGGLIINSGATVNPGNSPGELTVTGNAVWNAGGNYDWESMAINTNAGTQTAAGTDWDFIDITGTLTLGGLSIGNKFNLDLISLSSSATAGQIVGWDSAVGSTWLIARAASGIYLDSSLVGMNQNYSSLFNINTAGWTGSLPGGGFQVTTLGNTTDLYLQAIASASVPEPSQVAASLLLLSGLGIYLWRKKHAAQAKRQHS